MLTYAARPGPNFDLGCKLLERQVGIKPQVGRVISYQSSREGSRWQRIQVARFQGSQDESSDVRFERSFGQSQSPLFPRRTQSVAKPGHWLQFMAIEQIVK